MSEQKKRNPIGFKFDEEKQSAEWPDVDNSKKEDVPIPEGFQKIVDWMKNNFSTCDRMQDADCIYTTQEVFELLQSHLPSEGYKAEDVYKALESAGFNFHSPGKDISFVWLLKAKKAE